MDKQTAMNLFEAERQEFLELCRWTAKKIAKEKGHVTIDDVRDNVMLPLKIDGRVFGAVFNKSDWLKVGYTNTRRESSHGRPIAIFQLKKTQRPQGHFKKEMETGFGEQGRLGEAWERTESANSQARA